MFSFKFIKLESKTSGRLPPCFSSFCGTHGLTVTPLPGPFSPAHARDPTAVKKLQPSPSSPTESLDLRRPDGADQGSPRCQSRGPALPGGLAHLFPPTCSQNPKRNQSSNSAALCGVGPALAEVRRNRVLSDLSHGGVTVPTHKPALQNVLFSPPRPQAT